MKMLILIISILSMNIACASSEYEEILHHVGKGKSKKAIVLLEDYLDKHPPLFRSYFLLGILYLKDGKAEQSVKALEMVPEEEREANYWFLRLNAYLESPDRSPLRLHDMGEVLDRVIEVMSFLTDGADETLFEAAMITGDGRVEAICKKFELSEDPRCGIKGGGGIKK